jgi:hypothetical protein
LLFLAELAESTEVDARKVVRPTSVGVVQVIDITHDELVWHKMECMKFLERFIISTLSFSTDYQK